MNACMNDDASEECVARCGGDAQGKESSTARGR